MNEKEEIEYHFCAECEKIICDDCMEEKTPKTCSCKNGCKCYNHNDCSLCKNSKNLLKN